MRKVQMLTNADYITMGRRYGSDWIADQVKLAGTGWQRDLTALGKFGFGQAVLDNFNTVAGEHDQLRTDRPEMVAAKTTMVAAKAAQFASARHWIERATLLLSTLAQNDAALAARVNEALPSDESGFDAAINTLVKVLGEVAGRLPPDANVDDFIESAPAILAALKQTPGAVASAKTTTVTDTEEIDLLDGKLYVVIRDLNRAARSAIRSGLLSETMRSEYRFPRGRSTPSEDPAPTPS